jgi:branched-chain amino acid aminotransferase
MQREPLVYLDGKFVERSKASVSVFDHGLLYGDGVFEGIRAYSGSVFRLDDHIKRLFDSAKCIQLKLHLTEEGMKEAILETLRRNGLRDAYIRVVVTRGTGDLGIDPALCKKATVFIITEPMASVLGPKEPAVLKVSFSSVRRDAVDGTSHEVKSLNYLNSIMARIEASNSGFDDTIMLDRRGLVSEATVTNIFLVKDGRISTPSSASGILHGITRARIIELCRELGYDVQERDITPFELMTADEAFLVGTKSEVRAIGSVNGRTLGSGGSGAVTRRVVREFSKLVLKKEEGTQTLQAQPLRA